MLDEALAAYQEALRLRPQSPAVLNNLGNSLRKQGKLIEAEAALREALAFSPSYPEAHNNLGIALVQQGKVEEGVACYREALRLRPDYPDAHLNLSLSYLAQGRFDEGWSEYEWRWKLKGRSLPSSNKPLWDGSCPWKPFTLVLTPEQGLGDTIQFARYAALAQQQGATVIFQSPKPLTRLFASCPFIDRVVEQKAPLPFFDFHVPLLRLPGLFRTDRNTIPAPVPYLFADPGRREFWRRRLPDRPGLKVGLVWQGNPQYPGDRIRSVRLRQMEPLFQVASACFVSLQKGTGSEQRAELEERFAVADVGTEEWTDFAETAAMVANLDLVIAADTSVAHLAGALGVPVWLALPLAADWRWLRDGQDTPWYPTMRLFRQKRPGNWQDVFSQMAEELARLAARHSPQLRVPADVAGEHHRAGLEFFQQGRASVAVGALSRAVELAPQWDGAHNNLGAVLAGLGRHAEAASHFRDTVRLRPDSAAGHGNLGLAYLKQDKPVEALVYFERALRLNPNSSETHNNAGVAWVDLGQPDQALACYDESLRLSPQYDAARINRSRALLKVGQFARGWVEYEWRWRIPGTVSPPEPTWDGSPLSGRTILLHAEQGLGDILQFVRYAVLVKNRGGSVLLECPASLTRLLATCLGVDGVVSSGQSRPPADCHAPLLSLPRLFGADWASIPASIPYLSADAGRREHWRQQLAGSGGLRVGLVWQGNPNFGGDRQRSARLAQMAPLSRVPGVRLYSLQKGPSVEQLQAEAGQAVTDLGADGWSDFAETAAVVVNLDLVIAVDTAVAHLAGALGVPVWLALPQASDWRWLVGREDSPWYPSMRLFRQRRRGDWNEVFLRMARALEQRVQKNAPRSNPPPVVAPADPSRADYRQGLELLRQGKLAESVALLRRAVAFRPAEGEWQHELGCRAGPIRQAPGSH